MLGFPEQMNGRTGLFPQVLVRTIFCLATVKCRHKYLPERPKREVKLKDPSIRFGFNTGKAILLIAEYKHAQKEGPKIECYNIALTIYIA